MEQELRKIKKLYGEAMMHMCRQLFPTILEEEGKLINLLSKNFEPNHDLYNDIINCKMQESFKNFIYSLVNFKNQENIEINNTPSELFSKAGYDLYECKTEEEVQSFKKYYATEEELCTFYGKRLKTCRVFFAVKKNVWDIKRENFKTPQRQDEYGTSVISIQFTKDGMNTLSIKNRYNHTVSNPDATFGNNLENIIPGLTKSFEKYYEIVQKSPNSGFDMPNYVRANDGKYYKYNYEINNIYYCPYNIIIDNFEVKRYEKEKYIVLDYFILDLVNKKIDLYDKIIKDCFLDTIIDIEKIYIDNKEDKKEVNIILQNGEKITIILNKFNEMIHYKNDRLRAISDNFLRFNETLEGIDLPNLLSVGYDFLYYNESIEVLSLPKLREVGHGFLAGNKCIKKINLPKLERVGDDFLTNVRKLLILDLPKLKMVGDYFLFEGEHVSEVNFSSLEEAGDYFLTLNSKLEKIDLPNLKKIGEFFLSNNPIRKTITINCEKDKKNNK